jgi:hypothetical protein
MATKKATAKPAKVAAKPAAKQTTKATEKAAYPKDDGALTEKQVKQVAESAPKPRRTKAKTELFPVVEQAEPGVHIGNYSVRVVHDDGRVDFSIDWDRLKEHVASARV